MGFAQRVTELQTEGAYRVLARAQALEQAGRDIIHLEIGEPDFRAASHIGMAGIKAIAEGQARYTSPSGIAELRECLAHDAGKRRGMTIHPAQVVVAPGAKPNLFFATLALVGPGDEVLYPDPGFPTFDAMIRVAGATPVPYPLREDTGFSVDLDAFDRLISARTRLIVLNSPANPTGSVIPLADLRHIAAAAQRHDCWVISDEIYSRIVFDGATAPSIAALPSMAERTVIVDGFSKTYAMTGWRLGFGIMPETLAERVHLLMTHSVGCTAQFTQIAGVAALMGNQTWVEDIVAEYQQRRDAVVAGLNALPGITCRTPHGAFYAFPNVSALGITSDALADQILERGGVALLPGTAFGANGAGYLRISYTNSLDNVQRAIERIGHVVADLVAVAQQV